MVAAAVAFSLVPFARPSGAAPACTTSGPAGGAYSVTLCVSAPADGSVVSDDTMVTATAAITPSGAASVAKLVFHLDGAYLLTDFERPYTFVLPTATFVDGTKPLGVVAVLRDGFTTPATTVTLTFANGISSPPVNTNSFTPTPGTDPAPGSPFVFAATGDGASGRAQADQVVSLIDSWQPNLFAFLGDVYEKGTTTEFRNWYGPSGTSWGSFRPITNPVVGNHEYENGMAPGYFDYWDNIDDYYSYDSHGWHFIALNSTSQFNQSNPGTGQYEWLAQDLAANQSPCTVAYFHHPLLNIGPEGNNTRFDPIWKLLADSGVDIVLTGHDHNYQRWTPVDRDYQPAAGGITEFVAGAGGQGVRPFVTSDPRVVVAYDTSPQALGALRFELNPAGAAFTYRNTSGATIDNGVIPCTGAAPDTESPTVPAGVVATPAVGPAADLSWEPSTDNVGVASYTILRDGSPLATVDGHLTAYTDTAVDLGATYSYQVDAVDPVGNHSPRSAAVEVTITGIPPVITPGAFGVFSEGDAGSVTYDLPVTLSAPSTETVTIDWATIDTLNNPLAHAGSDFVAASGTVTFAPGDTTETVQIEVLGDTVDEPPLLWGEWGLVAFSNPTNATLNTTTFFGLGWFIIVDDDPTPAITPGTVGVWDEGDSGSTVWDLPVRLSNPSDVPVSIDWATIDTLTAPLTQAGSDFVAASGTLTFQPGETVRNIPLEILGDTLDEPPLLWGEWGLVSFTNPTNATLNTSGFFGLGLFIIVDDDP
jgi:hypothetical protein